MSTVRTTASQLYARRDELVRALRRWGHCAHALRLEECTLAGSVGSEVLGLLQAELYGLARDPALPAEHRAPLGALHDDVRGLLRDLYG